MTFTLFGWTITLFHGKPEPPAPVRFTGTVTRPRVVPDKEASNYFWDALQGGGTLVTQCGRCGRTHFCPNTDLDWEGGELEGLLAKAAEAPDKYVVDYDNHSVAVGEIDGVILPWGCPCHTAARYESFIWNERELIMKYLNKRITAEFEAAQAQVAKLGSAAAVIGK